MNRKKRRILLMVLLMLLGGSAYYFNQNSAPQLLAGEDKQQEFIKNMDDQEFADYLQEQVSKSEVQLKMQADMFFEAANEVGTVTIINPASNHYAICVQTTINEEEKIIYDSGIIKPKQYVTNGRLTTELTKGHYKVRHVITYYENNETQKRVGETIVMGQLTIAN